MAAVGRPRQHADMRTKWRVNQRDYRKAKQRHTKTNVETPWDVFYEYDAEFHFTIDVCAQIHNTKCPRFFSPEQNGLIQDWSTETCWMNPPYGRNIIDPWIAKAYYSSLAGATVLAFIPAYTSNQWWHDLVVGKAEIRYRLKRVTFVGKKNPATFPNVAVIYRPPTP